MNKKTKICLTVLIVAIILAGIIMVLVKHFNVDKTMQEGLKVVITLDETIDKTQIKELIDNSLNQNSIIQDVEIYGDSVAVTIDSITDEQKEELVNKINEKYYVDVPEEEKFTVEDLGISTMGNVRIRDLVKPAIIPIIVSAIIILIFYCIKYRKLNPYMVIIQTILTFAIAQVVLFSIIAIARIQIGYTTLPAVLLVYILTAYGLSVFFEDKLNKLEITSD